MGKSGMDKSSRIYVAGHRGLVGSAICRRLREEGYSNLIVRGRRELDLFQRPAVDAFFAAEKPEYVFLAAAKVGGILANSTYPVEFLRDNLAIEINVLDAAHRYGVKKIEVLGSSCIYPKLAPQPIKEESLLTGPLEPTNEWYAIAKIAGIKLAQAYWQQYGFRAISLMPTNLYGPGDQFDLKGSHVLPALLRKAHEARAGNLPEMVVWGSGNPRREFMHVDDLADAAVFLMLHYDDPGIINVGVGTDVTIRELAEMICRVTGFVGRLKFDTSKPDGTPRKLLDVSRLSGLGWRARIGLEEGIADTYRWFQQQGALHSVAT
jgi:GDP-L-fucose synthase